MMRRWHQKLHHCLSVHC